MFFSYSKNGERIARTKRRVKAEAFASIDADADRRLGRGLLSVLTSSRSRNYHFWVSVAPIPSPSGGKVVQRIKANPYLLILVIAAAARLWGIGFGLHHTMCRPDEETVAALAFRIFRGHFKTQFFSYPTLFMYISAVLYAITFVFGWLFGLFSSKGFFVSWATVNPWLLLLIDRLLSVACGIASVAILYSIVPPRLSPRRFWPWRSYPSAIRTLA